MLTLTYNDAGEFDKSFRSLACSGSLDTLGPVIESFKANMERIVCFWEFPIHMFAIGRMAPLGTAMARSASQYLSERLGTNVELPFPVELSVPGSGEPKTKVSMSAADLERLQFGQEAVFASMIVGTWTAFEVLAEDLWEAAMNLYPNCQIKSISKPEKDSPSKLKIAIDANEFMACGLSLQGRMGSFMKSDFKFDRFERIGGAYRTAFNRTFDAFDTEKNRSLFELAQCRNAIVHCAGVADDQFLRQNVNTQSPIPEFASVTKGAKIPFDGPIVKRIIDGAVKSTCSLVTEIDAWLLQQTGR